MEFSPQHHRTVPPSLSPVPPSPERQCVPLSTTSVNATPKYNHEVYNQPNIPQAQSTPSAQLKPEQQAEKPKVKRPRKKKEDGDAPPAAADGTEKPKKPRKPREPKDPNAPPRKRVKKNPEEAGATAKTSSNTSAGSHIIQPQPPLQSSSILQPPPPSLLQPTVSGSSTVASPGYGQIGKTEPSGNNVTNAPQFEALQSNPQSMSHDRTQSGQRAAYDPIRSASAENARLAGTPTPTPSSTYASPAIQRTTPSIQSLTEPPPPPKPTVTAPSTATAAASVLPSRTPTSEPKRPTPLKLDSALSATPQPTSIAEAARNLNLVPNGVPADRSVNEKLAAKDKAASRPLSPKPTVLARKKQSPPVAMGSGLLSGADFGRKGPAEPKQYAQVPNNCIVIDVPMKSQTNNYVNFLQEVEKKYGFDVAHPRIAEHRRRMAQMAAAGAAIESTNGTADEMSLDLSSMEDSDVEMGEGANADESGAVSEGKKKKKATRHDKYDLEDEFIDDTEQVWAEQALASNDGYFVWQGPLVPPEEEPTIAKANGKVTRGRGGRGRGARGDGAGTTRGGKTDSGEKKTARGGGTTRKPRLKKSDKEALEKEKADREKGGASSTKGTTESTEFPGVVGAS